MLAGDEILVLVPTTTASTSMHIQYEPPGENFTT